MIIDIGLGVMDGYERCKSLKQKEGLSHAPVIFISSNDFPEDNGKSQASGGTQHVMKPIEAESFLALVQSLVD